MPAPRANRLARRTFLIAAGAWGVLGLAGVARAQAKGKVWQVGYLSARSREASREHMADFVAGMRDQGYVEGANLVIHWRFADGAQYDRLPAAAAELVQSKVDVIVALASPAIRAAQRATTTIPIVMAATGDPVGSGFVKSLAKPGGNITGLSNYAGDLSAKYFEMLSAMVPKLARLALLGNPESSTYATVATNVRAAAQKAGIELVRVEARTREELERAFKLMKSERVEGIVVASDAFMGSHAKHIAKLALDQRLPSIHWLREYAEAGGLMSYGGISGNIRRAALYVDKIFKGAKPADLPVEQPTVFELVINLKTAKALGITIPQSILVRADKVIE